jgi:acetyltransferase-like isoleucine patch superfamily enzyme
MCGGFHLRAGPMQILKRLLRKISRNTSVPPSVRLGERVNLRYAKLETAGANYIDEGSKISGCVTLGYASTVGRYSELVGGTITVGHYCSLAPHCAVYAMNHPLNHLTTFVGKALWSGSMKRHQVSESVTIGSDVWLGHGSVVLPGVKIGDGAVIGAGAVVTRSIADFTIAVGNPAKPLRRRFNEEIVTLLQELRWWDYRPEHLREMRELFDIDFALEPKRAADSLRRYMGKSANYK